MRFRAIHGIDAVMRCGDIASARSTIWGFFPNPAYEDCLDECRSFWTQASGVCGCINVFDQPNLESLEEISAHLSSVREYLLNADDPNESSDDGRTLLTVGLTLCSNETCVPLVSRLLDLGADPNRPSPYAVFATAMTNTSSLALIERLIDCGLRINDVVDLTEDSAIMTSQTTTLLDYAEAVREYRCGKRVNRLSNEYAGGLSGRRKFVADVIDLLQQRGAKRLEELS